MKAWVSLATSLLFLGLAPLAANLYQHRWRVGPAVPQGVSIPELLGGEVGKGFAQPAPGLNFRFPQEHGPHLDYRTEWWYFTGNLAGEGQNYGYELTLFRQALLTPLEMLMPRTSKWASSQAMLGHFAISDLSAGKFYHFQRLSRTALGLAGSGPPSPGKDLAWVEDWHIRTGRNGTFELSARDGDCALQLSLTSLKRPVLQGQKGYSRKADQPGQASNYYSLTRLQTLGTLSTAGQLHSVSGLSWMDREWSTRPLGDELAGWDWFALQMSDGQELMFYQLRDRQGQATSWSAGSWVDARQIETHLNADQLKIEVTDWWASPLDGTRYPAGWRLKVAPNGAELRVTPRLANQELTGLGRYWEGAVRFAGQDGQGHALTGTGYVELVGYAADGLAKSSRGR